MGATCTGRSTQARVPAPARHRDARGRRSRRKAAATPSRRDRRRAGAPDRRRPTGMGALFKASAFAHPTARRAAGIRLKRVAHAAGPTSLLQARSLPASATRFFTRSGGVSQGVYASLNGGVGSNDAPDKVAENRAPHGGGARRRARPLAHRLSDPFARRGGRRRAVDARRAPARRRHRDANAAASRIGVSTADCGPVLFADAEARRDRRRACRLARRASPA